MFFRIFIIWAAQNKIQITSETNQSLQEVNLRRVPAWFHVIHNFLGEEVGDPELVGCATLKQFPIVQVETRLEAKNTLSKEKISLHHPYLISLTYTDFLVNASANLNSHDVKEEEIKGEYLQLG